MFTSEVSPPNFTETFMVSILVVLKVEFGCKYQLSANAFTWQCFRHKISLCHIRNYKLWKRSFVVVDVSI